MASSESPFVTSLVQLVVGVGEISNDWAKDVAGGGRDSWYGTEMTRLALKLLISVFSTVQYYLPRATFFFFWIFKTLEELVFESLPVFPSPGEG